MIYTAQAVANLWLAPIPCNPSPAGRVPSLHTGEVVGSIPTAPTRKHQPKHYLRGCPLPFPPIVDREQVVISPTKLGENRGTLFDTCSGIDRTQPDLGLEDPVMRRKRRRRRLRCLRDGIALAQAEGLRYIVLVLPAVVGAAGNDPSRRAWKDVVIGAVESAFRFG